MREGKDIEDADRDVNGPVLIPEIYKTNFMSREMSAIASVAYT